jgi:hypothetical protein
MLRPAILLWAIYTMFAQPGLPACWLEAVPCQFHVHFGHGHAELPHSHAYLYDLAQGQASQPNPFPAFDSMLLVLLLALSGASARLIKRSDQSGIASWIFAPDPPPPKPAFAI